MGWPKGKPRGKQSPEHIAKRFTPESNVNRSIVMLKALNTPEYKANQKKRYQDPDVIAKMSATGLKFHREHPGFQKKINNRPEVKAKTSASLKKYYLTHQQYESPEACIKSRNTPEIFALIQQFGSSLINNIRGRYYGINNRCNPDNFYDRKHYYDRGIRNLFTSQLDFLNYIIFELHITQFSQIQGLEIDRIDNDGNYEPGNIHFVTHAVNAKNRCSWKK